MNVLNAKREFDRSIGNVIIAYRFFSRTLPPEALFESGAPIRLNGTEFERYEQALALLVEAGWAFFCRMDACLEALISRLDVTPSTLLDQLRVSGEFSEEDLNALRTARELRNIYHHGDGDWQLLKNSPRSVRTAPDRQPHLYPEHGEKFHAFLFVKVASFLSRRTLRAV